MSEFIPKINNNIGVNTLSDTSQPEPPEVTMPAVGDTMHISVSERGYFSVVDDCFTPPKDTKIIEVEVKAIKGVKVIFE